jgi:hypothetical protein
MDVSISSTVNNPKLTCYLLSRVTRNRISGHPHILTKRQPMEFPPKLSSWGIPHDSIPTSYPALVEPCAQCVGGISGSASGSNSRSSGSTSSSKVIKYPVEKAGVGARGGPEVSPVHHRVGVDSVISSTSLYISPTRAPCT